MVLTDEQKRKLLKTLTEKWKGSRHCPICEDNNWSLKDKVFQANEAPPFAISARPLAFPFFFMVCSNCGYTLTFNAITLGLTELQVGENDK